jgi:phosphomevalonate kinase
MSAPRGWRCPGKLFWLGEYAVLEGAPAIVAAVDRAAAVQSTDRADAAIRLQTSLSATTHVLRAADGARLPCANADAALAGAVLDALANAGRLRTQGCDTVADSTALSVGAGERKLGLGSSGAVAAGLTLAWGTWGHAPEPAAVAEVAVAAHRAFQGGRGSGADVVASVFGGLTRQARGEVPQRIAIPEGLQFVALDTGESAHTPSMVSGVRAACAASPAEGRARMAELARLAAEGAAALAEADLDAWLAIVAAYADAEAAMGDWAKVPIVNTAVRDAMDAAAAAGWVSKPSGAGGGDVVVAFARTEAGRARIRETCAARGVRVLPLALTDDGAITGSL